MEVFKFALIVVGVDYMADDFEDSFFEHGCGDALIVVQRGAVILEFARQSTSLLKALLSAVENAQRAGCRVVRVEPDPLATLSDMAQRAGLSRTALSHYASGARGQNFPSPVARVTSDSPLWDWAAVSVWLSGQGVLDVSACESAQIIRDFNKSLGVNQGTSVTLIIAQPSLPNISLYRQGHLQANAGSSSGASPWQIKTNEMYFQIQAGSEMSGTEITMRTTST